MERYDAGATSDDAVDRQCPTPAERPLSALQATNADVWVRHMFPCWETISSLPAVAEGQVGFDDVDPSVVRVPARCNVPCAEV